MPVQFERLIKGEQYDRPELAELWGYRDWHAIGRGVVTPSGDNKVVLFVTGEKQESLTQYRDHFEGDDLHWEGETGHQNDDRIARAAERGDELHLFHRERHHDLFTYVGRIYLRAMTPQTDRPSQFVFTTLRSEALATSSLLTEEQAQGDVEDAFIPDEEGKQRLRQHVGYERSRRNRAEAIRLHGTRCVVCGFDFNAVYGREFARDFIEIHLLESVAAGVRTTDPARDLVPLCSNCHKMAHRQRKRITSVEELRAMVQANYVARPR